jgi:hypothetical protein
VVLSHPAAAESDSRILKFAEWMGVPARRITVGGDWGALLSSMRESGSANYFVAASAEALASLAKQSPASLREFVYNHCASLLVVGGRSVPGFNEALDGLTGGQVRGQKPAARKRDFQIPKSGQALSMQFAGLSFSSGRVEPIAAFDLAPSKGPDVQEIVAADGSPVFVRTACGSCEVFLLAASQVSDIDERITHDGRVEENYDQLIPLLIFLRHCFGPACWHTPVSTARLIIDDPLLNRNYGFLDYHTLLDSMRSADYGTSIAFIPWNHWRTSKRRAAQLFDGGSRLSICVHGCDHTNREFGLLDDAALQWKAGTAVQRMERHEKRTGLPFERVMVFPQGWFSGQAIHALRTNSYLAAVNTTCFPMDEQSGPLTLGDLLRPAVTRFHGFPVFQRRYPNNLIDSAFDLFVGKPALLVEHHQDFREGCSKLEEFARGLNQVEPGLKWTTLSSQLMQSCSVRTVSGKNTEVRFFTGKFQFRNTGTMRRTFRLSRHEPDPSIVSEVLVDGGQVPFWLEGDVLRFEMEADPAAVVNVEVRDAVKPHRAAMRGPGLIYRVGVPVRRALSEFRDNTLTRHPRILEAATGLARAMKATADHDRAGLA